MTNLIGNLTSILVSRDLFPTTHFSTPSWKTQLLFVGLFGFLFVNAKSLPLVHTLRLLPSVYRLFRPRLSNNSRTASRTADSIQESAITSASPSLFRYEVANHRVAPLDLDVNLHKSNSTFFTDADISRAALLTKLLSPALARLGPADFVLAAVQSSFKRPVAPWQAYRVSSRILAWDERSLYLVTYFSKPDTDGLLAEVDLRGGPTAVLDDKVLGKGVFATLVTKYVFKAGRTTVRPLDVLMEAGLLHHEERPGRGAVLGISEIQEGVERGLKYVNSGFV
ncbi:Putative HotDog domain superfamily protein [Colletotrichum destructivum]|uniref:HotDog domain superfamily protein n=1 Tax=Colletotrichum destructivum TaxID=34406 RepID=A0AAX4J1S3_9PEZI|nr:Putative HotDog domain superfamily protein [Colletotrichum destructivum]